MSEKIYAWFLRLYPSRFRKAYGDEAMQLFRDRLRDEAWFFRRLRLWFDLLFDLTISIPKEHRRVPIITAALVQRSTAGIPSFHLLEEEPLRPGAIFFGGLLASAALCVFLFLFSHVGDARPWRTSSVNQASDDQASDKVSPSAGQVQERASNAEVKSGTTSPEFHQQQEQPSSKPQDAFDAMIHLFDTHQVVMFGEMHGNEQEYAWLCQLISKPEFADRVDDIVVEFGNALYQKTVDRYIAGNSVPIEEVQKAWRNMVLSTVPVQPVYEQFYKAVREANLKRQGKHPLRIVLGSPPADWDKIKDHSDLELYMNEREQWYTQVVKNEVLAKHHRGLLIMGAGHFLRGEDQALQDELLIQQNRPVPPVNKSQLGPRYIEHELRAAGANPYLVVFGTNAVDNHGTVDKRFDSWHVPVIVPLSGNWVGELPAQPVISGGHAPMTPLTLADQADALLYVAPCDSLRNTYVPHAELDGTPYGREIARRNMIILGHPENVLFDETEPSCVQTSPSQ